MQPSQATVAFLGMGANLGDRLGHLRGALDALHATPGVEVIRTSSVYETAPMYVLGQPTFLNACAEVRTTLRPLALLEVMLAVESQLGRVRTLDKGPRTIDLDLLLYGDRTIHAARLDVPHPLMHERGFVLRPLAELASGRRHPERGQTIGELLAALPPDPTLIRHCGPLRGG